MNDDCSSEAPDYSVASSWLALSSEVPREVDVFYVYPTIYIDKFPLNMDIYREDLRENARGLLTAQAGVYSGAANLFAPFYRQQSAATQGMEADNGGRDGFADPVFRVGYEDVARAFEYYLANLNTSRPFILAGHSQGAMVIIELMRRKLGDQELLRRLVAAYAIGYTVKRSDLQNYPQLKLAQGETDTGVIITYNTQGKGAVGSPVLLRDAVAVNPLNWKTDATPAGCESNIKAVFFNDATGEVLEEIQHFCGACIDPVTGALLATDIKTPEIIDLQKLGRWPDGVYHRFDYAFFYTNLQVNVTKRISAYLRLEQQS